MDFTTMTEDELYKLSASNYQQMKQAEANYNAITEELHKRKEEHKARLWEDVKTALQKYIEVSGIEAKGQAYNDYIGELNSHSFDTIGVIEIEKFF